MNPSAAGWINKLGFLLDQHPHTYTDFGELYDDLRDYGFIYGINMEVFPCIPREVILTEDEKAKINLITAQYYGYQLHTPGSFEVFLEELLAFYHLLGLDKFSFLGKLLAGSAAPAKLEAIMDNRVYLDTNPISKTFNNFATNALLCTDIFAFKLFLEGHQNTRQLAQELEFSVINLTQQVLDKRQQDGRTLKLSSIFQHSLTYLHKTGDSKTLTSSHSHEVFQLAQKTYYLDMACLAAWETDGIHPETQELMTKLTAEMGLETTHLHSAEHQLGNFFENHIKALPYLAEEHFTEHLHTGMDKVVNKLILRNSKRLSRELSESRELVQLISQSAIRELTPAEKKKVRSQLLDIFKSIPSLLIFLLPGGAILLPLFIKVIPQLLPTAFDDNRITEEENTSKI